MSHKCFLSNVNLVEQFIQLNIATRSLLYCTV
jgi:hypothetical protein